MYQLVIGFVAAEPIETFTPARLAAISTSVAAESDVDPSQVTTVAYAASTRVEITIVTTDSSASAAVEETLSTSVFADANAASEFLNLQVTSAPTIAVETVTRLVPPEITVGLSILANASSKIVIFIIAVAAGILAILCCCFFRYRGKGKARSLARGRAQIGFGRSLTGSTSPRGPSTEMEDFSVCKGDKPSEPSAASEGAIDIDKISVSAKKKSIASATPREAAKIAALNDMVEQARRASKLKLIPWNEFKMAEKLGEGTFGTVHACSFKATPCAVKQLREDKESSVQLLADMLREHDAMMGLRHPNVVLMLGIATDHVRRVGIVLELLEISLLELLHSTAEYKEYRTWHASFLSIASDVAKGVAYLHFNNVLHGNLKPGNVLLSDSWVAKVADFGSTNSKLGSATEGERIHGTPSYMSPEVARGENNQTAAVDVWSFGCLLVHMGTLCPPYFALKCIHTMDIVRVVQRGDVSPVQVLLDDSERREYRCPASIVALAKQCCHREPTQRPDMPAIAGTLVSPAIQTGIFEGAEETRPLVRLQRSRASVEGKGTFDASKGTYDASVATPSARGGEEAPSPRSSPAHSNASKAKFRSLSKYAPAGASSTRGEPSPRAAASVGSAFESAFDCKAEKCVESTFNRIFDGKAEASTANANKTSIGLTASLARASMSNVNAGNKSQRSQGSQRSSARGALEHATESARCAHDGADRSPSKRRAVVGASIIGSTSQPVGVNVHQATSQQTTTRHALSPAGDASDTDISSRSSTAGAAKSPVGGAVAAALSAAAAPSSAAPKSAAAPLGSPAAFSIRFTMAQKVARIKEELSLDPLLPVAKAVAEANAAMGIEGQGTLAQQVDHLLTELGVL